MDNKGQEAGKMKNILINELRKELDKEMKNPKHDPDRIDELTDMIYELEFGDDSEEHIRSAEERLIADTEKVLTAKKTVIRRLVPAAACAALLFGLNQASLNAYGENVFKRAYHFTKGGVSIMIG